MAQPPQQQQLCKATVIERDAAQLLEKNNVVFA